MDMRTILRLTDWHFHIHMARKRKRSLPSSAAPRRKPWDDMLMDSAIIGAISFFATLGDVATLAGLFIAAKAFGAGFFIQLAVERGIKRNR